MINQIKFLVVCFLAIANFPGYAKASFERDTLTTDKGRNIVITFIKHGTLMLDIDGYIVHVDPVSMFCDNYSEMPKADLLLVGHEHGDHFDNKSIASVIKPGTVFYSNKAVSEKNSKSTALNVGDVRKVNEYITLTATAAYNYTKGKENFHPKGRDIGFLLDIDDLRIYIADDTEDIPEFSKLKDVDVAFLPANQPYTMTVAQLIRAAETISPKILYPYHYGETDLTPLINHFKENDKIDVRIRQMQ
jgi:Predicted Zn-dependent hydrolases of the beta-lactamase fold